MGTEVIQIKRDKHSKRKKTREKRDGKMGESFCWRESRNREEGRYATHNLALHLLSPPPVTRLKIKIKIK